MREVDASFEGHIAQEQINLTELYEIQLQSGAIYYFTSHSEDIKWGSPPKTYISLPIKRGFIKTQTNLQNDTVELNLAHITAELSDAAQKNLMDGAKVTIKRVVYNESYGAGMEITIFKGIADISYNRNVLTAECISIFGSLNIQVPKNVYQEQCNCQLFDTNCGLSMASYKTSGTADSDADDYFTIKDSGFTVPSTGYFDLGEVEMKSGNNIGLKRMVRTAINGQISVAVAVPNKVLSGDEYDIYPGCDKTPECCNDRFSNISKFNGYVHMPNAEEVVF